MRYAVALNNWVSSGSNHLSFSRLGQNLWMRLAKHFARVKIDGNRALLVGWGGLTGTTADAE